MSYVMKIRIITCWGNVLYLAIYYEHYNHPWAKQVIFNYVSHALSRGIFLKVR